MILRKKKKKTKEGVIFLCFKPTSLRAAPSLLAIVVVSGFALLLVVHAEALGPEVRAVDDAMGVAGRQFGRPVVGSRPKKSWTSLIACQSRGSIMSSLILNLNYLIVIPSFFANLFWPL